MLSCMPCHIFVNCICSPDIISNSVLDLHPSQPHPSTLLVDPTKMCRQGGGGSRNLHNSRGMNVIVPGRSLSILDTNIHSHMVMNDANSNSMNARRNYNYGGRTNKRYRRKVNTYCVKEAEVMREAAYGAKMATDECQHQFKHRHWNCSSHPRSIKRILARGKLNAQS